LKGRGLEIDLAGEARKVVRFIQGTVRSSGARGAVVGLSGGIDSSVVGALCVRALGKDSVVALLMPSKHTPRSDLDDAVSLADTWGVRRLRVDISPLADAVAGSLDVKVDRIALANIQARVRMVLLYYVANSEGILVAGTGDRSEEEIGFFTKYGDGGADFLPIAHLYKTQVRMLGEFLGIPKKIVEKPASPQLWTGHTASEELPVDYEKLDVILNSILDKDLSHREAAKAAGVPLKAVKQVIWMRGRSAHKRMPPPSLA
jgi:NAD+ synthase